VVTRSKVPLSATSGFYENRPRNWRLTFAAADFLVGPQLIDSAERPVFAAPEAVVPYPTILRKTVFAAIFLRLANLAAKTWMFRSGRFAGIFRNWLHLCEAAIYKQFRSRDVAALVGCEKHNGFGDLAGRAEPAERNSVGNHLQAFLARFAGSQQIA
jgi:hypothetical protein